MNNISNNNINEDHLDYNPNPKNNHEDKNYNINEPSNSMYDNLQLEKVLNDNDEKEDDLHQFISEIKSKHDINDTVNDTVNDDYNLVSGYGNNDKIKDDQGYNGVDKVGISLNINNGNNCNIEDKINSNLTKCMGDSGDKASSDIKINRNHITNNNECH